MDRYSVDITGFQKLLVGTEFETLTLRQYLPMYLGMRQYLPMYLGKGEKFSST